MTSQADIRLAVYKVHDQIITLSTAPVVCEYPQPYVVGASVEADTSTPAGIACYDAGTGQFTAPLSGGYRLKLYSARGSWTPQIDALDTAPTLRARLGVVTGTSVTTVGIERQIQRNIENLDNGYLELNAGDIVGLEAFASDGVGVIRGDELSFAIRQPNYPYRPVMGWFIEYLGELTPNQPPSGSLTGTNSAATDGTQSVLTCTATDADGSIVEYDFYEGGNSTPATGSWLQSGTSNTSTVTPPGGGSSIQTTNYYCDVYDNDYAVTRTGPFTAARSSTVPPAPNQAPVVALSGSPLFGFNGEQITLTATATDDTGISVYDFQARRTGSSVVFDTIQYGFSSTCTTIPRNNDETTYRCLVTDIDGSTSTSNLVNAARVAPQATPPVAVVTSNKVQSSQPYNYTFSGAQSVATSFPIARYTFTVVSAAGTFVISDGASSSVNYTFPNTASGPASCSLVVYDSNGNPSQNPAVVEIYNAETVVQTQTPTVQIFSTDAGNTPKSQFEIGETVYYGAIARDPQNQPISFSFNGGSTFVAGTLNPTTGNYSANYSTSYSTSGAKQQTVIARDTDGYTGTALTVVYITEPVPNQPPIVELTGDNPAALNGTPVNLTCTATDTDGSVVRYVFYRNISTVIQDSSSNTCTDIPPFSPTQNTTTDYSCVAYDNEGRGTLSNTYSVVRYPPVVAPNQPPMATLNATNTAAINGTSSTLTCTAVDVDGAVTNYAFYRMVAASSTVGSGTLIQNGASNVCTTTPPDGGLTPTTTYYACDVTDNIGAVTRSNNVAVNRAIGIPTQPNQPPQAVLTGTNSGAFNGTSTTLTCTAADPEGLPLTYNFRRNGTSFQSGFSTTASDVPPNDTTTVYDCVVSDGLNNTTSNQFIVVRQASPNPPNQAPVAALSGTPLTGANYSTVTLTCFASDVDGAAIRYRFYSLLDYTNPSSTGTLLYDGGSNSITVNSNAADEFKGFVCDVSDNLGATTRSNEVIIVRGTPVTPPDVPNQAPTCTLSASNVAGNNGTSSDFTATATDADGAVQRVEFYRNGTLVNTDTTPPYAYTEVPPSNANTTYFARAYDDDGAITQSNSVVIARTVPPTPPNQAPTATLTGDSIANINGVPINLTCTASDSDGSIVRFLFKKNGAVIQDSPSDNTVTDTPNNNTQTTYTCEVTDNGGATTVSNAVIASRAATPPPPPNQPPVAQLSGDTLTGFNGTAVNLTCTASDADGVVVIYNFRRNGVSFQSGSSSTATNIPVDNATTNYDCIVTDNLGATTTTNVVSVSRQARPNQPPTSVLSGTNLAAFNGTSTTLTDQASDSDGTVVRYVFKRNGTTIQDSSANTCTDIPVDDAQTTYTCDAYDNGGAFTTSNAVVVSRVNEVGTPVVQINSTDSGGAPKSVFRTGENVYFVATGSDPQGQSLEFSFDGGSNYVAGTFNPSNGTYFANYQRTYSVAGTYQQTVVARDPDGNLANAETTVVINPNQPPVVTLTGDNPNSPNGTPLTLTCTAVDPDGTIAQYDFYRNGNVLLQSGSSNTYSENPPSSPDQSITTVYNCRVFDTEGASTLSSDFLVTRFPLVPPPEHPIGESNMIIFNPVTVPPDSSVLLHSNVPENDALMFVPPEWTARNASSANLWGDIAYGNGKFVATSVAQNKVMYSTDGINWTTVTVPFTKVWRGVAYGNGIFVAVSESSASDQVMTSLDGITWTARNAAASLDWESVVYGNGLFVAVASSGNGNRVMTSPDGANWTSRVSASDEPWYSVTFGNGLFVAVSHSNGFVMTSPDGINWTTHRCPDNQWESITFGGGTFVAVGQSGVGNRVMTSTDGTNWASRTSAADNDWFSVTYGSGMFVATAITGNGNRVMTSQDGGITWKSRATPANNSWGGVGYGNGLFVAVASNGTQRVMTYNSASFTLGQQVIYNSNKHLYEVLAFATGDDPVEGAALVPPTWLDLGPINRYKMFDRGVTLQTTNPKSVDVTLLPGVAADTVALLNVSGTSARVVVTNPATGANTWTSRSAAEANPWRSVAYGNGIYVAVSDTGTNRVQTSPDGITWTPRAAAEANAWMSVTFGNGKFIAVASSGTNRVMESADGITWVARAAAAALQWQSVTYGNNKFVAVANSGIGNRVMTSTDGVTWTGQLSAADNDWRSIVHGNGIFVAVSIDGTNRVMTSIDGITWISRSAAQANPWYSVTFGRGIFVAVSTTGSNQVMTSLDGINWTTRNATSTNQWRAVGFGNGVFVALSITGIGNRVMTSLDGFTWSARTSAGDNTWENIAYGNGKFVAVSSDGANRVMTSPDGIVLYDTTRNITGLADVAFPDLIATAAETIRIVIDAGSTGTAKIGEALMGVQQFIGEANFGTSVGIVDYSRKETDTFGNLILVERNFSKRGNYDVTIQTASVAAVQSLLAAVRAIPVVYIGDVTRAETIIYGFYKNFSIVLTSWSISSCNIEVEGLT